MKNIKSIIRRLGDETSFSAILAAIEDKDSTGKQYTGVYYDVTKHTTRRLRRIIHPLIISVRQEMHELS